ncbi:jupiter microtubule associated homolog 2-like isoform X2 [Acipenser ruthenus]|uniref:jupiter microtubule associated homolog 2-like isoform X2 n=1 Tax=Acipenser ruthenus TaxID=7906 RepID=UPI0027412E29|nr:jupiter microtubule associated homolog 2-like isoform X2 [Acipenser ruthenus]
MTSTNMFQGLDTSAKSSSRVLRPPGGGSSNLFGSAEENASPNRTHKMASSIFAAPEAPQSHPKKTNPPGGKDSGIFGGAQPSQPPQHPRPSAGKTSNIFGDPVSSSTAPIHPNKPKVGQAAEHTRSHISYQIPSADTNIFAGKSAEKEKVECVVQKKQEAAPQPSVDEHEPRLGPRPRAHNKVIQPPGGKSSVVFY